jgi:hypothetical protein
MCSISLTVVVMPRSLGLVMRLAISSADRPVYCQTTLTTGILMFGKMSVGIVRMLTAPMISRSMAKTAKV